MKGAGTFARAYRMRVYPTGRQRAQLARLFGAARYVWNWALDRRTQAYRYDGTRLNWVALSRELTGLRRAEATQWLGELPREPFTQVLRDLERAFRNFFERRAKYPRSSTAAASVPCASRSTSAECNSSAEKVVIDGHT